MVGRSVQRRLSADNAAISCTLVSFSTLNRSHLLFATTEIRQSSPDIVVQHADARGLFDGSIWPKTGYASIV